MPSLPLSAFRSRRVAAGESLPGPYGLLRWLALCLLLSSLGCAGYAEQTRDARSALDHSSPNGALALYNDALDVDRAQDLPEELGGDNGLLILERAMVLQQLEMYELASRDLGIADKQVELLDFSTNALDDIGKYVFSDDTGPYRAPPYEKLMINTMNMVNYLAMGDLSGARVEARRLAIMQKHIRDTENAALALVGPGSYLAGFTFEKSGRFDQALRYYDEALAFGGYESLAPAVAELAERANYETPRLTALRDRAPARDPKATAEILVILNYGRVPEKIAKRIPIGLALTYASGDLSPGDHSRANQLAAEGLVKWVNYPELSRRRHLGGEAGVRFGGQWHPVEGALDVDGEARAAYKRIRGRVIGSAITRLISRMVVGGVSQAAAGKNKGLGLLLSLGTQAALTAADTPDTRSWATLPARIAFSRLRVRPGVHTVTLQASGVKRTHRLTLKDGDWAAINLTVLK